MRHPIRQARFADGSKLALCCCLLVASLTSSSAAQAQAQAAEPPPQAGSSPAPQPGEPPEPSHDSGEDEPRPLPPQGGVLDAAVTPAGPHVTNPVTTWTALVVGGVALGVGVGLGVSAQSTYDDYKSIQVEDADDAADANEKYSQAHGQGIAANILIPTGALILAAGITLLILDLVGTQEEPPPVALAPSADGAMLFWGGSL